MMTRFFPSPIPRLFLITLSLLPGFASGEVAAARFAGGSSGTSAHSEIVEELSVKVRGGFITVEREWAQDNWRIKPEWSRVTRQGNSLSYRRLGFQPESTLSCTPGGACVTTASSTTYSFFEGLQKILVEGGGYRWLEFRGGWIRFDADGCAISEGDPNGTRAVIVYEDLPSGVTAPSDFPTNLGGFLCRRASGAVQRFKTIRDDLNNNVISFEYASGTTNLSAVADYSGRRITYEYADGRLSKTTDVIGGTWGYGYDAKGALVRKTDPVGRFTLLSYDGLGRVASTRDQDGSGADMSYDYVNSSGQSHAKVALTDGRIWDVWYFPEGNVARRDLNGFTLEKTVKDGARRYVTTHFNGTKTAVELNKFMQPIAVGLPDGSEITYQYESKLNRLAKRTAADGTVAAYQYDTRGNLTRYVSAYQTAEMRYYDFTYDARGNLTKISYPGPAGKRPTLDLDYDDYGNPTTGKDPLGAVTKTTYEVQGLPTLVEGPDGKRETYAYDKAGNLTSAKDATGLTVTHQYDAAGIVQNMVWGSSFTNQYQFHKSGRPKRISDASGAAVVWDYDPHGRLIAATDMNKRGVSMTYDTFGRFATQTDGNGNKIEFKYATGSEVGGARFEAPARVKFPTFEQINYYDKFGRHIRSTYVDNDGKQIPGMESSYDSVGNLTSWTHPDGSGLQFRYDRLGRPTTIRDKMSRSVTLGYDETGNVSSLQDTLGNTTKFEYDLKGRMSAYQKPMGERTEFVWDPSDINTEIRDAKGQRLVYNHTGGGRISGYDAYDAGGSKVYSVSFTFDGNGFLVGWNDGTASTTYERNAVGHLLSQTVNYGPFTLGSSYQYTPGGFLTSLTNPEGNTTTYGYDAGGNLVRVDLPGFGSVTATAFNWYEPTKVLYPGGATTDTKRNGLLYPSSIQTKDAGQNTVQDLSYSRGNDLGISGRIADGKSVDYEYDSLAHLVRAGDKSYSYDSEGNLVGPGVPFAPWSYNKNNQLLNDGEYDYGYDANGNLAAKTKNGVGWNYDYDPENRLTKVTATGGSVVARYGYDPFGRRLWKEVGGTRTYFYYEEEGLTGEYDNTGKLKVGYGFRPGSPFSTNPLYLSKDGKMYFYHADAIGTPRKLVGSDGVVAWSAEYDALGMATVSPDSKVQSPFRLPGQYYDSETGLHYNHSRYYDPATARYITPDPHGPIQGLNLYAYAEGNPVNIIDPRGQCVWGAVIGAATSVVFSLLIQKFMEPCKPINWGRVAVDAAIGAGVGLVTCGLGAGFRYLQAADKARYLAQGAPTIASQGGGRLGSGFFSRIFGGGGRQAAAQAEAASIRASNNALASNPRVAQLIDELKPINAAGRDSSGAALSNNCSQCTDLGLRALSGTRGLSAEAAHTGRTMDELHALYSRLFPGQVGAPSAAIDAAALRDAVAKLPPGTQVYVGGYNPVLQPGAPGAHAFQGVNLPGVGPVFLDAQGGTTADLIYQNYRFFTLPFRPLGI